MSTTEFEKNTVTFYSTQNQDICLVLSDLDCHLLFFWEFAISARSKNVSMNLLIYAFS